ncbi:MAG: NADP-dependent oxidoreductase [Verrucomicrobia bacterium]|nr:MAG: NADP-dependent oxidoreductase [Verrucomicrobiota bacterium]
MSTVREIRLKSRPLGVPTPDNFELVSTSLHAPREGEVLVRNLWMSVDPYMRGRMDEGPSYIAPFELNQALEGTAVGKVIESNDPNMQPDDYVKSFFGGKEAFVAKASEVEKLNPVLPLTVAPLETYLTVLGAPGLTGYIGLFCIAALKPGERVFISGATGAVGSTACVLAKAIGCYVVGTAGSEEKRLWLERELGVDAGINYRAPHLESAVAKAFPTGIDVYFENAGGDQLRVALDNMRTFGRIAFSGSISQYNNTTAPSNNANLHNIVTRKLRAEGFIVTDHLGQFENFHRIAADLIHAGKLKWHHTVFEGISAVPQAFVDLCSGKTFGKSLVRLSSE